MVSECPHSQESILSECAYKSLERGVCSAPCLALKGALLLMNALSDLKLLANRQFSQKVALKCAPT